MYKIYIEGGEDNEEDKSINSTLRALPEDKEHKANAEIEGKEWVLRAGLDALHKAVGKSHKKGGMQVLLNEGDFIFSDDKGVAISKGEAKLFELKEPSSKKKEAWTPARMIQKNIDTKDYNRLISVLNDKKSDDVARTSASMMLQKYVNTLGSVAYLQESQKGEPVPEFAKGVAPVYEAGLKQEIDSQKQYMAKGGIFQRGGTNQYVVPRNPNLRGSLPYYTQQAPALPVIPQGPFSWNPDLPELQMDPTQPGYLQPINRIPTPVAADPGFVSASPNYMPGGAGNPITGTDGAGRIPSQRGIGAGNGSAANRNGMVNGIWTGDNFPTVDPKTGKVSDKWNAMTGFKDIYDYAKAVNYTGPIDKNNFGKSAKDIQQYMMTNYPDLVNELHDNPPGGFNQPNSGKPDDSKLGVRWQAIADRLTKENELKPTNPQGIVDLTDTPNVQATPPAAAPVPVAGKSTTSVPNPKKAGNTILPYNPSIPLSPLQSLNVAYSGLQALSVPKFMPMRPQVDSPLIELERLDPRTQINRANSAAYQAYQANSILNPTLAAANNASVYGRNLEAINDIQGQYDNQNVQIANQQNMANNQIERQDMQQNTQFNYDYYNNVQRVNQNYADETRAARNQTLGLFNQYRSQNDALAASLQGQRMYTRPVTDRRGRPVLDRNGNQVMQQAPLFDVDNSGWTPQVRYTGAGGLENVPNQPNTGDVFNSTMQSLISQGVKPETAAIVAGRLAGSKTGVQYSQPQYNPAFKKGGRMRNKSK